MLKTLPICHLDTNLSQIFLKNFIFSSRGLFHNIVKASLLPVAFSDHKAVIASVLINSNPAQAPRWRFNTTLLRDETFKTKFSCQLTDFVDINEGSVDDPRIFWDAIKVFIRNFTVCYASSIRKARSSRLHDLESKLSALDGLLQQSYDEDVKLQFDLVKKEINAIMKQRAEFLIHRTRQMYYFSGARPSRLLALRLQSNEHFSDISTIKSKDGNILNEPSQVNATLRSCHAELYRSEVSHNQDACDNFLSKILLPKLSEEDSLKLDTPITLDELKEAASDMCNGKSPGLDGIPPEFYTAFWDSLGPLLFDMIQAAVERRSFSRDMNIAVISLLLKKDKDPNDCSSYRPLSLLNADLKIYAKLLARRLQPVMTKLVNCDQTGFIRTRLASDNLRRLLHIIHGTSSLTLPAAVLSLDAMKAFDRLEWPYL